jgi:hypothetical protein
VGVVGGWLLALCAVPAAAEPLTGGSNALPAVAAPLAAASESESRRAGPADGVPKFVTPGGVDRSTVQGELPSTSKTVELLLEMQGKNPGLEAGERPRPDAPAARAAAAAASAVKQVFGVDEGSPFGAPEVLSAKPGAAASPQSVDWSAAPPSSIGGGSLSGGGVSTRDAYRPAEAGHRSSDEDDVRWLIPREWVRFIRENRDKVILASVGLLLALWALSAIFSGRHK